MSFLAPVFTAFEAIAPVISVVSGVMGFFSSMQQAKAQEQMGEYNARIAAWQAYNQALGYSEQAAELERQNRRRLAAAKVTALKSGVELAGSPIYALGEIAELHAQDLASLYRNWEIGNIVGVNRANYLRYQGQEAAAATRFDAFIGLGKTLLTARDLSKRSSPSVQAPGTTGTSRSGIGNQVPGRRGSNYGIPAGGGHLGG